MAEKIVENFRSKAPKVSGTTLIDHAKRVALGLNCSEYVLMSYISEQVGTPEPYDIVKVQMRTGLTSGQQDRLISRLTEEKYICWSIKSKTNVPTQKWYAQFSDLEKEFEKFWTDLIDGKIRNAWPGSRPVAEKLFRKVREKYSFDYIMKQRREYFRYLDRLLRIKGFDRQKMMATVFLNPEKERFNEKWHTYCPEPPKPKKKPVLSDKEKKRLYDK